MTPEELRTRLLAEVEAKLKEALRDEGEPQTLSEMEAIALKMGQAVKERVMQELVTARPEPEIEKRCEACGGNLSYKGKRTKWVVTQAGEVQVARDYYYCEGCRRGFFPQDKRLGIQSGLNRREMAQQVVWLSGLLPYEQCGAVFRRVGG